MNKFDKLECTRRMCGVLHENDEGFDSVPENLPLSYYEAKRLVSKLGLEEKKGM